MDLKTLHEMPSWDWPENASQVIVAALKDEKSQVPDRLLAAELAGYLSIMNGQTVASLLDIINAPAQPEEVRAQTATALGPALEEVDMDGFDEDDSAISESSFKKIQHTFQTVYNDLKTPKLVRRRILESSVRAPQPWHAAAVRTAYAEPDEEWRLTAVFCMQYVRDFETEILESLKSRNTDIRYHAIIAAGNWEVRKAWPCIARLLKNQTGDKRDIIEAIEAAASINPDDAAELIGPYLDSDDEDISEAAMDALSMVEGFIDEEESDFDDEEDEEEDEQ